jgi:hypothetical protein
VGLLDTAFGPDWQQFDQQQQQQMDPSLLLKLSSLEAEDMAKLAGLMDKMTVMSRYVQGLDRAGHPLLTSACMHCVCSWIWRAVRVLLLGRMHFMPSTPHSCQPVS